MVGEQLKDHYRQVFNSTLELVPVLAASADDRAIDPYGRSAGSLSGIFRILGVASFYCFGDVAGFRSYLARASNLKLDLCRRANAGEPVDLSLVTLLCYRDVLNALASGSFEVAAEICRNMGKDDNASRKFDHPFDRAMGESVRSVLLGEGGTTEGLTKNASKKGGKNFEGYCQLLEGIAQRSQTKVQESLAAMAAGHARLVSRGEFMHTEDRCLNVWGIALLNLANAKGLEVEMNSEHVPKVLLVTDTEYK